ncbi:MAG: RNA methyltransferase [Myxococcota bacterium]
MMERITSLQNPRIKALLRLIDKAAERREAGVAVVEGEKEIRLALAGGLAVREVYYCPALGGIVPPGVGQVIEVSRDVFAKIAYRDDSDGLVAVAAVPERRLDDLQLGSLPLVMVVTAVEKPGNLGAILRTADGVGADAVIVCDPRCDPWNPNVIRASVGTVFTMPLAVATSDAARAWLTARGVKTVAATPSADSDLWSAAALGGPCAIVVGTEHEGLDDAWMAAADVRVKIPMRGRNDSLNVSVAAAILAYEALRRRAG